MWDPAAAQQALAAPVEVRPASQATGSQAPLLVQPSCSLPDVSSLPCFRDWQGEGQVQTAPARPLPPGRRNKHATMTSVLPGGSSNLMVDAYASVALACVAHAARRFAGLDCGASAQAPGAHVPLRTPLLLHSTSVWYDDKYAARVAPSVVAVRPDQVLSLERWGSPAVGEGGVIVSGAAASPALLRELDARARRAPASVPRRYTHVAGEWERALAAFLRSVPGCAADDALMVLAEAGYRMAEAQAALSALGRQAELGEPGSFTPLQRRRRFPPYIDDRAWRRWSQGEVVRFVSAVEDVGSDFVAVARAVGTRCTRECVQFYYAAFKGGGGRLAVGGGRGEWHGYREQAWSADGRRPRTPPAQACVPVPVAAGAHREWKRMQAAWAAPLVEFHWDVCLVCAQGGDLLMCDSCNLSFHMGCLGIVKEDLNLHAPWACPMCTLDFQRASPVERGGYLPLPAVLGATSAGERLLDERLATDPETYEPQQAPVAFSKFASPWVSQHATPLDALRDARELVREGCEAIEAQRKRRVRGRADLVRTRVMARAASLPKDVLARYLAVAPEASVGGSKRRAPGPAPEPASKRAKPGSDGSEGQPCT